MTGVAIFDSTSYSFSPYAVPVFVTALLMLAFGARVLLRRWSRVSVALFSMTAACAVWLFAFTFMYSTREESVALFWAHVAYLGVPFIAPSVYQFTVEILRIHGLRRLETWQGWLLGGFFSLIGMRTSLLITHVQLYRWGFYPRYGLTMSVPFLAFFFGYLIAAVVEFLRASPAARAPVAAATVAAAAATTTFSHPTARRATPPAAPAKWSARWSAPCWPYGRAVIRSSDPPPDTAMASRSN